MTVHDQRRGGDRAFRQAVFWSPIAVIRTQRGAVPGSLCFHLRDIRISETKTMLNRVAAAVQSSLQADAIVSMACNLLALAVGFVDDCLEFFDRESWL